MSQPALVCRGGIKRARAPRVRHRWLSTRLPQAGLDRRGIHRPGPPWTASPAPSSPGTTLLFMTAICHRGHRHVPSRGVPYTCLPPDIGSLAPLPCSLSSGTWPSPGPPRHPDHQKPPLFLLRPRHRAALQLAARGVQEPLHPIPASPPRRLPYLIPPICQLDTARHPPTSLHLRCKSVSRRDTASAAPFLFLPLPLSLSCMLPLSSTHGLDQNGSNEELSLSPCEALSYSLHVRAGDPTGFIILPGTASTNPPETRPCACSCRAHGLGFTRSGSRATAPPLPAPSGLELQPRSWCCNTTSLHPPLDPAATRAIPTPLLVPLSTTITTDIHISLLHPSMPY